VSVTASTGVAAPGLLLTTMEPPPSSVSEFNDWADTEHIPERQAIEGFRTALRFVCAEGWPRYLAIYDLADLSVLEHPAYLAISGNGLSPWSRRILAGVAGHWRFSGELIAAHPQATFTGSQAPVVSLLLVRWRDGQEDWSESIAAGLRASFGELPGVFQIRAFAARRNGAFNYVGLVESSLPLARGSLDPTKFGASGRAIDLINVYAPCWRRTA
jgi:hypothetical protein